MRMQPDPIDRLLREAAGRPADPEPSRRANRAALDQALGRLQRRDARFRILRTSTITAALLLGLIAPLGSDDFEITVETRQKAGKEWKVYRQGARGEEVWTSHYWTDAGLDDKSAEALLQQRAAGAGVLVGLLGWQDGSNRHFTLVREYIIDGHFVSESSPVPGQGDRIPNWFKAYVGHDIGPLITTIEETRESRGPDFTVPMYFGGLAWLVNGWRIRPPDREEIIYFRGERTDGVRTRDDEGF
jgi:hypothetical protein